MECRLTRIVVGPEGLGGGGWGSWRGGQAWQTALGLAASEGRKEVVLELLGKGADANKANKVIRADTCIYTRTDCLTWW